MTFGLESETLTDEAVRVLVLDYAHVAIIAYIIR